jgi:hypothetical protein
VPCRAWLHLHGRSPSQLRELLRRRRRQRSSRPPKAQASRKPAAPAESGPCQIGVIAATNDLFTVQKVGLTVFGNEYAEVPVTWGFDDLVFARARAAAGGMTVRRIAYARGAFDSYYHPKPTLFRNSRDELTTLVREIVGSAGCERYLVVTRLSGQLEGTNQSLNGIGVLNRGIGTGVLDHTYLFAYLRMIVFDGQTFEIRKDPHANLESVLARAAANLTRTKNENMHELDNSAFSTSPPEAANSAALRDGARNLLTERLDKYLPDYFNP